jgi:HAMP domain-containing protein
MNKEQRSQLRLHLLRIGAYVAGFFWLAFVWGAIKVLSAPDTGKHSHLAGWAILIIATGVMIATMNHWVKYLQLVLGAFILGCLLATIQGHLLNGAPFPRLIAAALTALLIGCSLISWTLAGRKLRMLDRVALVAFLGALVGGMAQGTPTCGVVGLAIGFGCLLIAWLYNRSLSGNKTRPENGNGGTVASVRG